MLKYKIPQIVTLTQNNYQNIVHDDEWEQIGNIYTKRKELNV